MTVLIYDSNAFNSRTRWGRLNIPGPIQGRLNIPAFGWQCNNNDQLKKEIILKNKEIMSYDNKS